MGLRNKAAAAQVIEEVAAEVATLTGGALALARRAEAVAADDLALACQLAALPFVEDHARRDGRRAVW